MSKQSLGKIIEIKNSIKFQKEKNILEIRKKLLKKNLIKRKKKLIKWPFYLTSGLKGCLNQKGW